MANLETTYLGLKLKNPIIVGSSGLTHDVNHIEKLVKAGAGAIVLKSLFEEQIKQEINHSISTAEGSDYPEAADLIAGYTKENSIGDYLQLIRDAKAKFDIPIIASINCYSSNEWVNFAKKIETAGADAIELNMHILNSDKDVSTSKIEDLFYSIAENMRNAISIPIAFKLGDNFLNLVGFTNRLYIHGINGVVLFNRFYQPDININNISIVPSPIFSTPADIRHSLRWVAIVSSKVEDLDISASTGIHDGEAVIKQLLAGAQTVQVCSAIYKNNEQVISDMLNDLSQWMEDKEYNSLDEFRGKLNYKNIPNSEMYERTQFMKYFSSED